MATGDEGQLANLERAGRQLERNRFRRALAGYEAVLKVDPGSVPARLGKATCLLALKRHDEGRRLLAELDPIEDPTLRSRRLRVEAWGLLFEKEWGRAIDLIDKSLPTVEHQRSRMLLTKAYALAQLGRTVEAGQALREAWRLGELEQTDCQAVVHLAIVADEPAIGRKAAAALLRSRYILGAALAWLLQSVLGNHVLLVRGPIFVSIFFAPLIVFEPVEILAGWACFGLICAVIGSTHRMPAVALLGIFLALLFGGTTGLLYLATDPELSGWTCAAMLLIGVPGLALALARANRRYRRRRAAAEASGAADVASPKPTTDEPSKATGPRSTPRPWQYLVWPAVLIGFAILICRATDGSTGERTQEVFEGIQPDEVAWQYISFGPKGLEAAVFLLDLRHTPTGDGGTDFSAILLNRGDWPIDEVTIRLTLFGAEGQVVEVVPMRHGPGPVHPGIESRSRLPSIQTTPGPGSWRNACPRSWGRLSESVTRRIPSARASRSLMWLGDHIPGLNYSAILTRPQDPWVEMNVDVEVGKALQE